MGKIEIIVPTLFGVEAVCAREIRNLGYETSSVTDGRITFFGDFEAVCRANMWIRTGERVLIKIGEFKAVNFDELYEQSKKLPWADWISKTGAFPVKGFSLKSALSSIPACQSVIKKSVADALSEKYGIKLFSETGVTGQIQFSIVRDTVTLMIDTSGNALYKRGYRTRTNDAPIRETLAAAMVELSRWRCDKTFADPFCGSGTLPIEAAMRAKNIAPGLKRGFAAEGFIGAKYWSAARDEAKSLIKPEVDLDIRACDIDESAVLLTRENARRAGVLEALRISDAPVSKFYCDTYKGSIITNPPYGERMLEIKAAGDLYRELGQVYKKLNNWALFAITPNGNFENLFGKKADKKRKLYNGMLKCDFYQYFFNK
jgi:putative N6-adenine-specific DNA methylase